MKFILTILLAVMTWLFVQEKYKSHTIAQKKLFLAFKLGYYSREKFKRIPIEYAFKHDSTKFVNFKKY